MTASWRILEGDALDRLRDLPAGSVHTCVTSPPYFGLRDYGAAGQIGLEATPDEFVEALVAVFREVRRVLRDDGTVWLNLGDSYATRWSSRRDDGGRAGLGPGEDRARQHAAPDGFKSKDLIGIPWLVAFALRADGWYLRSDIVWAKPNPMPESVTDRPTRSHEYVFLLTKRPRYFYDGQAIREDAQDWGDRDRSDPLYDGTAYPERINGHTGLGRQDYADAGRNKRSVWTVSTQPYPGAHFATFPPKLIEPCILAGAPERACSQCGTPWRRLVERTAMVVRPGPGRPGLQEAAKGGSSSRTATTGTMLEAPTSRTVGFEPACEHTAEPAPGVVLDPFSGAGTTGLVARRLRRDYIGIELSPEYAEISRERIATDERLGGRSPSSRPEPIDGQAELDLFGEVG